MHTVSFYLSLSLSPLIVSMHFWIHISIVSVWVNYTVPMLARYVWSQYIMNDWVSANFDDDAQHNCCCLSKLLLMYIRYNTNNILLMTIWANIQASTHLLASNVAGSLLYLLYILSTHLGNSAFLRTTGGIRYNFHVEEEHNSRTYINFVSRP